MTRPNKNNRVKRLTAEKREAARLAVLARKEAQERKAKIAEMAVLRERLLREKLAEKRRCVVEATGEYWGYHISDDGTLLSKKIKELWPDEALAQREGRGSLRFGIDEMGLNL